MQIVGQDSVQTNKQVGRSTTDAFFSRDAYVGLTGTFGTVTVGQQISPFFKSQALLNPFSGSTTLNPLIVQSYRAPYGRAMAGGDLVSNAVVYAGKARRMRPPRQKGGRRRLQYGHPNGRGR